MATVNLSGEHLRGENKSGVVAVAGAEREISTEDVERAVESASAMQLPAGGTSKVRCIIGESSDGGKMNIVGLGQAESRGLRRGIVTTTDAIVESIKKAARDDT